MADMSTVPPLDAAIDKVADLIKKRFSEIGLSPDGVVEIVRWSDGPWGVRIAEVGYSINEGDGKASGFTFMQSDLPYGLAVCAQVERLLVTMLAENADDDEVARETDRLLTCIEIEEP